MTCDEFRSINVCPIAFRNSTRAQRAASFAHMRVCQECVDYIHRTRRNEEWDRCSQLLYHMWQVDCLDPEFVSVAFPGIK